MIHSYSLTGLSNNQPSITSTQTLSLLNELMKCENLGSHNLLLGAGIISHNFSVIFSTFVSYLHFNPCRFGSSVNVNIIKEVCFVYVMEVLQNTFPNFS